MDVKQRFAQPENYNAKTRADIRYIVLHLAEKPGSDAKDHADYFAQRAEGKSMHYFVDRRGVWQSVPETYTAWHCGTRGIYAHAYCRNQNSIGIALCGEKDNHGQLVLPQETMERAARLIQMLQNKYSINAEHILRHYDVTHKICPEPFVRQTGRWLCFKQMFGG